MIERSPIQERRRRYIRLSVVALSLAVVYMVWRDQFPPYTPQVQARRFTGLPFPRSSQVLEFKEAWGPLHLKGWLSMVLVIDETAFKNVVREARALGYRRMPTQEGDYPAGLIQQFSTFDSEGYYILKQHDDDRIPSYTAIVVDTKNRRVYVQLLFD